jgi:uncharacterized protein
MPTRDAAPSERPAGSIDTERSRAFYCQLFGWTAEEPAEEFGGYSRQQTHPATER